ncbi:hypothetical protein P4U99_00390 [Brevibacillus agri]|uniref:hypothetical protein n=1 Tax=Brevibacillus TaxID=55080 RepID=UPI000271BBB5|nr:MULTISPECIES: hypothetical protein [Brevibacillus]EJL43220.1 hypothetical protein PMI08_02765 [Brevibacillus sp. CF112]MBY0052544.1 hypothetical protein [Brevibacillus agri]MCG5250886.1 hypothetical protein [Brevibacillus agri]MDN4092085.1 hypothetical protein [Brevibacillus agri]MDR9505109.1 hypothetical protein [Brevibacillus agri]
MTRKNRQQKWTVASLLVSTTLLFAGCGQGTSPSTATYAAASTLVGGGFVVLLIVIVELLFQPKKWKAGREQA